MTGADTGARGLAVALTLIVAPGAALPAVRVAEMFPFKSVVVAAGVKAPPSDRKLTGYEEIVTLFESVTVAVKVTVEPADPELAARVGLLGTRMTCAAVLAAAPELLLAPLLEPPLEDVPPELEVPPLLPPLPMWAPPPPQAAKVKENRTATKPRAIV